MWLLGKYIDRTIKDRVDHEIGMLIDSVNLSEEVQNAVDKIFKYDRSVLYRIRAEVVAMVTSHIKTAYSEIINREEIIDDIVERIRRKQIK